MKLSVVDTSQRTNETKSKQIYSVERERERERERDTKAHSFAR